MSRRKGLSFIVKEKKFDKKKFDNALNWLLWIAITIFIAWVTVYCFAEHIVSIGESMSPTVVNAEDVYYSRFTYIIGKPKRDDVIAFHLNGNTNSHLYIRRVVGIPGDTLTVNGGRLYINGELYDGEADLSYINDAGLLENGVTLSDGEYFVIGDNINSSEDSRSGNVGNIPEKDIVGKVWISVSLDDKDIHLIR